VTALAAVLGGLAVWLALPGRVMARAFPVAGRPLAVRGPGRQARGLAASAAPAAAAGALVVLLDGTSLVLGLVLTGAAAGAWHLLLGARRRRAASLRSERVVEVCEWLAGELRAGQPPQTAVRRAVTAWPELEPAAAAAELGADVPATLRRLARLPGASGLAEVAAAWQVSHTSGGTMALALGQVADGVRRRRSTQQLVASELASAEATARLVALLPVLVLAMGSGLGGDPWGFLLTTPAGLACLALGTALVLAGLAWIERISAAAVDP
jgi:tight adherence protein B